MQRHALGLRLRGSRAALAQSLVWTGLVVVGEKLLEHRFEMAAAKDHQVIEQLSACGAHLPRPNS